MTIERTFELAFEHQRAGRAAEAGPLYREVLAAEPRHDRAMYLLSVIALASGHHEEAVDWLTRAIEITPDNPAYHSNLGEAYRRQGKARDASQAFLRAVTLNPELAIPSFNLGIVLQELGELDSAVACFERSADLEPEKGVFQYRLARALEERGQAVRALGHYQCALALMPGSADIARDLARALRRCGRLRAADAMERRTKTGLRHDTSAERTPAFDEKRLGTNDSAQAAFSAAIAENPEFAAAHHNLGIVKARLGELDEALACFERATDFAPGEFEFQKLLARALEDNGEVARAIGHYHTALVLDPSSAEVLSNLSGALRKLARANVAVVVSRRAVSLPGEHALAHRELARSLGDINRWDEAIVSGKRALELQPNDSGIALELGHLLLESGLIGEAIEHYRRAASLDPNGWHAHSALIFAMMFHSECDGEALLAEGRRWSERFATPLRKHVRAHENDRDPGRRLRIGYVAPTFWDHVMALFTLPILRHHDTTKFEVFCYSSALKPDAITKEFQACADGWRDVAKLDDPTLAELVREDRIDILVDLNMHMGDARLRTFACKPAPVQVTYAYPATTGVEGVGYRVADRYSSTTTPDKDPAYSETALVVPDTYWCYGPRSREPAVSALPALAGRGVRFGCLNGLWKINDEVLRLWARVLRAVDGSKLTLLSPGARMNLGRPVRLARSQRRVFDLMEHAGVERERVEFVPRVSRTEYLAYYGDIDIGLDNFPYNGHTTTLDSLFMGVPVVTLVGKTALGRAGLCFAQNLDLLELVAHGEDEYVAIAARLAEDLPKLAALRATLRERLERSPLMNAERFVRNFEAGLRSAWQSFCSGDEGG